MGKRSWELDLSKSPTELLAHIGARMDTFFEEELAGLLGGETCIAEGARYMLRGGGKRVRPALVVLAARSCRGPMAIDLNALLALAAATELMHTYSLVHDDLPCMDDDDTRRGRPSCHVMFGVESAVWAGDSLQVEAIRLLHASLHKPALLRDAVGVLAKGCGFQGMVGGQWLDLLWEGSEPTREKVKRIHAQKTAALMSSCGELGALAGNADQEERDILRRVGYNVGLAFQAIDDLLDVVGDESTVGKRTGKDLEAGKMSMAGIAGITETRCYAEDLVGKVVADVERLEGEAAPSLAALARYLLRRTR